jgi:hemerythrin superfamily protein
MPDAITTLTQDHQKVDALFTRFSSGAADGERRGMVEEIVRELSVHAAIEEQVLYPVVAEEVPGGQELVDESLQEHQLVKETLTLIERLGPESPEVDELVGSLIQHVRHHVQEEERELFPQLRQAVGSEQLDEMG